MNEAASEFSIEVNNPTTDNNGATGKNLGFFGI